MNCSCLVEPWDGETPEFYQEKMVVCRKPHECVECKRTIEAGEKAEYIAGKWEGEVITSYTCTECREIAKVIARCGYCIGCLWDDFCVAVREYEDEIPWTPIAELSKQARDKVLEYIDEVWKEMEK